MVFAVVVFFVGGLHAEITSNVLENPRHFGIVAMRQPEREHLNDALRGQFVGLSQRDIRDLQGFFGEAVGFGVKRRLSRDLDELADNLFRDRETIPDDLLGRRFLETEHIVQSLADDSFLVSLGEIVQDKQGVVSGHLVARFVAAHRSLGHPKVFGKGRHGLTGPFPDRAYDGRQLNVFFHGRPTYTLTNYIVWVYSLLCNLNLRLLSNEDYHNKEGESVIQQAPVVAGEPRGLRTRGARAGLQAAVCGAGLLGRRDLAADHRGSQEARRAGRGRGLGRMEETWLTQEEVKGLTGWQDRWIRESRDRLGCRPGEVGRNGKPQPLYALSCLPAEAQHKWARQQRVVPIEFEPSESPGQLALDLMVPVGSKMSPKDRAVAEERFRVIAPLLEPQQYRSLWIGRTKDQLVELLAQTNTRTLKTTGEKVRLSKRTIYNWLARWEGKKDDRSGLAALVDRDRVTKGKPKQFNEAALDLVVKLITPKPGADGYGELTVQDAFTAYEEERRWRQVMTGKRLENGDGRRLRNYLDPEGHLLPEAQLPQVCYDTFRVWVHRLPKPLLTLGRNGRERFDATETPYSYRNLAKLKPLDWVVMDHRQLDLFCLLPDRKGGWKLGRPWVTAALDMRTRRWLAWVIVEQPNSQSIATCLKRLLLADGRPKAFYWDNGQDFECDWLDGVLTSLKVKVTHSIVKRARSKIIEPNFKRLANFERGLPWWTGHKSDARPDERLEKLQRQHARWMKDESVERAFQTLDEVAALYDQLFVDLNRRPLKGVGMQTVTPNGRADQSPDTVWNSLISGVPREKVDRATLLFMFRERREVKVAHGQIRLSYHGAQFIYNPAADDDPLALAPFNGKAVEVALDKLDLQTVAVFYEDRLICLADNMELRGMREETFKADERVRRRMHRWFKSLVWAVRRAARASISLSSRPPRTAPEGCYVPVQARVGGVAVSNTVTMAVQKDGQPCSEPDNPFMQTFLGGGRVGAINLVRTMFESDVDVIAPATFTLDQAGGYFRQETGGVFAFNPFFALPPAGACTAYSRSGNLLTGIPIPFVPALGLDAGDITLNGPSGAAALLRTVMGDSTDYDPTLVGGPEGVSEAQDAPLYLSPGNYRVSGEGGADIGAINADADVSEPPRWTNSGEFTEVPRDNEVNFTWTGPGAARVVVGNIRHRRDDRGGRLSWHCRRRA